MAELSAALPDDQSYEEQFRTELVELIPQVRAFARAMTRHNAEADDLAQETLLRALGAWRSFTPGTNLKLWVFTILRNAFYSKKRKAWRAPLLEPGFAERVLVADASPTASLELNELRMALTTLPPEQREALILVGAGGLSYDEAAEVCACAQGTIKSRVSRARDTLRAAFESGSYRRDGLSAAACADRILAEALRYAPQYAPARASA